jgi:preprotein translocase subunit SecD
MVLYLKSNLVYITVVKISEMKKKNRIWLRVILIVIIFLAAIYIDWPNINITVPKPNAVINEKSPFVHFKKSGTLLKIKTNYKIKEGLDIQGGSSLVYVADLSKIANNEKNNAMDSLQKVISNRINAFGLTEPVVQTSKVGNEYRLNIELPGIKNTQQAEDLIGKTAQLEFKQYVNGKFVDTGLGGDDLSHASVTYDQTTDQPQISLQFNSAGSKKFATITANNVGKPLAIYLDNNLVSAPKVDQEITGGNAVITGSFTYAQANALAIQLNAGALKAPIKLEQEETVGATLGTDSVEKSIIAGIIGIITVSIFMLVYYRLLGIFSTIGLFFYLLIMYAIFQLIGVTVTMGGIAGLILSIGMSMETDVLVFERIREEMRKGRTFLAASRLGFQKAWPSIRDSNAVSLIIAVILYTDGGTVRGFAIVLAIGIVVGLTTTFLGTRTFLELVARTSLAKHNWLFRVESSEELS